ncbi:hypothetical protein CVT25_011213 [Psilocybe cyanescens]|uniref:C2H2-type domain-containing protein n=1 Tax=Psilocybe cyanescens TaxID=93625 RepID=A0A409WGW9_PSICY|nr:hypothetical protein CVT25_011213 [Psilocybe cyanescens]
MPLLQSHLHPYGSSRNSTSYAEANIDLDQLEFLSLDSKESEINARYNTHRHHGTLPSLGQFVNGVLPGNGSTLDAPLRALKMDRSDCSQAAQSPSISKYLAPPCNLPYSYANWPHNIPRAAVDSTNDHRYPPTPVYVPHSLHMTFEDTCNLANIFHRKLSVKTCQDITKETPFPCAHCGLGFSDPAKRHKHVKNEHPEVIVEKRTKSPYAHIGATSVNDSDCTDSDSRPARPLPSRRAPVEAPRKTRSSMSIMVCSNMPRFHRATQT